MKFLKAFLIILSFLLGFNVTAQDSYISQPVEITEDGKLFLFGSFHSTSDYYRLEELAQSEEYEELKRSLRSTFDHNGAYMGFCFSHIEYLVAQNKRQEAEFFIENFFHDGNLRNWQVHYTEATIWLEILSKKYKKAKLLLINLLKQKAEQYKQDVMPPSFCKRVTNEVRNLSRALHEIQSSRLLRRKPLSMKEAKSRIAIEEAQHRKRLIKQANIINRLDNTSKRGIRSCLSQINLGNTVQSFLLKEFFSRIRNNPRKVRNTRKENLEQRIQRLKGKDPVV